MIWNDLIRRKRPVYMKHELNLYASAKEVVWTVSALSDFEGRIDHKRGKTSHFERMGRVM